MHASASAQSLFRLVVRQRGGGVCVCVGAYGPGGLYRLSEGALCCWNFKLSEFDSLNPAILGQLADQRQGRPAIRALEGRERFLGGGPSKRT